MGQCSGTDLTASPSHSYFCMAWWARHGHGREFCWKILKKSQQVMWKTRSPLKTFPSANISWQHVSLFPSLWKIWTPPCCFQDEFSGFMYKSDVLQKEHIFLLGTSHPYAHRSQQETLSLPWPCLFGMGISDSFHALGGFEDHCGEWVEITGSPIFPENNCS